jgi:hypothetical protein
MISVGLMIRCKTTSPSVVLRKKRHVLEYADVAGSCKCSLLDQHRLHDKYNAVVTVICGPATLIPGTERSRLQGVNRDRQMP